MTPTLHSYERAKERIGMNPKAAGHFMRNALERGKTKDSVTGKKQRAWLEAKENACGMKALVYNGMCLIVDGDVVVTMYKVPEWFTKSNRYNGKNKIRNQAKYARFNGYQEMRMAG